MSAPSEPMNQTAPAEDKLYGLLAEYDSPGALVEAAKAVRSAGYEKFDCHSPFPVHGIDPAMGIRWTILPILVFGGGVTGLLGGVLLQWWANAYEWPWIVSGKPFFSLPAAIPITFELTILLSAFTAFLGMWGLNKLPQLWHPLFSSERFGKASTDGFFVSVEAHDPHFDPQKTAEVLRAAGATAVEQVVYRTSPEHRRVPKQVMAFILVSALMALVPFAFIANARVARSDKPHYHIIPDMDFQPKRRAQAPTSIFEDGRASRLWPDGTVARGELREDDHFYRGLEAGDWAETFPRQMEVSPQTMARGKHRYEITCRPCHGDDGSGSGMVHERAAQIGSPTWVQPTDLNTELVVRQPHGQLFNTITHGIRTMPGYASQITEADRWAIVLYLRALQRRSKTVVDDVPPRLRGKIR
jgi:mono/diheme cytochrome c family protein